MSTVVLLFFCAVSIINADENSQSDVGATLLHHIMDKHSWQPLPFIAPLTLSNIKIGPITIPVTQHVVMLLINAGLLIAVFVGAFRKSGIIPSKGASLLEPLVFFVRDTIVYPAMGEEMGKQWLSFFYTIFFFILCANFLGMIPLFSTITGNLSITSALAIMIFVTLVVTGVKKKGIIRFFTTMVPEGVALPVGIFLFFIEVPSLIIKTGVLAIRLFANMIAGHLVIFSLLMLIFIIHPVASVISVPLALFINLLECLVAFIQAMVFTMLSAVFIKTAASNH
jgi:F-type H+-transporting ATPase subunit a